jgi:outer membrane protein
MIERIISITSPFLVLSLTFLSFAAEAAAADNDAVQEGPELSLETAIEAALEANFSYQIAALDPEIARQSVTRAEAAFDSELFASASVSQAEQASTFSQTEGTSSDNRSYQVGARKRFAYGTTVTAQSNLNRRDSNAGVNTSNLSQAADVSLSLRQPLLRGFGRDANLARVEGAQAGVTAARQSFRDTVLQILAETERAYWSVARLQEQLALNESSLRVAETLLEEAKERLRVGVATQIEVLQADAARAQRLEEIIETRRNLGDATDLLFQYMGAVSAGTGRPGNDGPRVAGLATDYRPLPDFNEILERALREDPLLAQQEALIAQREWDIAAVEGDTRPTLDLVLSGGYSGVDDRDADAALESALDRDGHAWAVGLEFSMPWRMRGEKAALLASEKRLEQEILRYRELKQSLFRSVRSAWRNLDAVNQSVEAAQLTVSLQEATFEREKGKYEEGLSVFRDVLEVQRDLDQARIRLLQSKYNRLSSEIDIARLTGQILERHGLDSALLPDQ